MQAVETEFAGGGGVDLIGSLGASVCTHFKHSICHLCHFVL